MTVELLKSSIGKVVFIDETGHNHGEIFATKAKEFAQIKNLDLVKVSMKGVVPICKLMDYSKYKFDESKSAKTNHSPSNILKEIWVGINISDHDLKTKHNKVKEFLGKKYKVRYVIKTKESRMSHGDMLVKIVKDLEDFKELGTWNNPNSVERETSITITPI